MFLLSQLAMACTSRCVGCADGGCALVPVECSLDLKSRRAAMQQGSLRPGQPGWRDAISMQSTAGEGLCT